MEANERLCKDEISDTCQQQNDAVDSDGPLLEVILVHPSSRERNKR